MTGMKEGAGEDPFADDGSTTAVAESGPTETAPQSDDSTGSPDPPATGGQQFRIPYKFRRDGVQDGRDRVPLFLQPETKRDEREAVRELEERFDDDVSLTDLREALVMVGLGHLDEVEAHLAEWGYGMTFEE
jgi:hypothetical protein